MSRPTRILIHLAAGTVVALTAILTDVVLGHARVWGPLQVIVLAAALGMAAAGFSDPPFGRAALLSTKLSLSVMSGFLCVAFGEVGLRAVGFDFADEERAWKQIPPYYRQPIVPTGEAFFRRSGPEEWTGQVLYTRMKQLGVDPEPYADEPTVTVTYNENGFRIPDALSDWTIAISGDSFTELGYLADEQLFTSIVGRTLGLAVANLGTSYTGPLTQLSYLREYGVAPGTTDTVMVFFEGNDLENLDAEDEALTRWKETGHREFREFTRQPSLVRALQQVFTRVFSISKSSEQSPVSAYFASAQGDVPVTLDHTPPGRTGLPEPTRRRLDTVFGQYAELGRARSLRVWMAYMPIKQRVHDGQLAFAAAATDGQRTWRPSDLPGVISELCERHGIRFIDLTPALVADAHRNGRLLYNSLWDMHLNADGSRVVGEELARRLAGRD